jgi:8-oxo-dGTP pyrophosphatase MutT (NUDIX family)
MGTIPAGMPTLSQIRERLARHRFTEAGAASGARRLQASVAIVLHEDSREGTSTLLIRRAEHAGDPWSGHMAFPGGRRDPADASPDVTAARETFEEVGIELPRPIGRLDDFFGTRNPRVGEVCVTPFVYEVAPRPPLFPNHEVESVVWIPLRWMLDPVSAVAYRITRPDGREESFPAIQYGDYRVWGLTYRILTGFLELIGRKLPHAPGALTLHQGG